MVKVITGLAKGMPLHTLPGEDIVRPTSQRVKEAMFSAIQFEIEGRRALDAFAGSGQLGIEALSRGAARCLFLDSDAGALAVLRRNLEKTRLGDRAQLMQLDALRWLRNAAEIFDLIFLDPPYRQGLLPNAIAGAADRLAPGGLLLCEAPARESVPDRHGEVELDRVYRHGKTQVLLYRRQGEAEGQAEL